MEVLEASAPGLSVAWSGPSMSDSRSNCRVSELRAGDIGQLTPQAEA